VTGVTFVNEGGTLSEDIFHLCSCLDYFDIEEKMAVINMTFFSRNSLLFAKNVPPHPVTVAGNNKSHDLANIVSDIDPN